MLLILALCSVWTLTGGQCANDRHWMQRTPYTNLYSVIASSTQLSFPTCIDWCKSHRCNALAYNESSSNCSVSDIPLFRVSQEDPTSKGAVRWSPQQPTNLATLPDARAELSTEQIYGPAFHAIDGNPATYAGTYWQHLPWLRITLHRPAMIHEITVMNRNAWGALDGVQYYRFHNVEFRVAHSVAELEQSTSLFNHMPGFLYAGHVRTFPCIYCELHHPGYPDTLWALGNLIQLQLVDRRNRLLDVGEVLVNGLFI